MSLFHAQLSITAFYLTMNAIFGFSQAITEEKEDGTLGLMRLADISPLSIIIGKVSGRLTDAALLLAIQFPFTILAITLGGVSWPQVTAVYVTLVVYLWLLASIGTVASVIHSTGAGAARWTAGVIGIYTLPPLVATTGFVQWPWIIALYQLISLPMQLSAVTESSFNDSAWSSPAAFGVIAGLACLGWAWIVFDGAVAGVELVRTSALRSTKRRVSRRVWARPIVWREFRFLMGGPPWLLARLLTHLTLMGIMLYLQDSVGRGFAWASLLCGLFALIDGTWSASRLFRDEIRDRTWSSLVQTPHPISRLAFEKVCGWGLGNLPSIVVPYLFILTTVAVHENASRFDQAAELMLGALTVEAAVFAYLHLLVLTTLYLGWQSTPLTLTVSFAAGWLYVVTIYSNNIPASGACTLFVFTLLLLIAMTAGLQFQILRRLGTLAETS